ncbi:MAG: sugar transferase [Paludibacteraceae bacterium]|nr:sugar transferase [Paludibacteraceae bacterium]MBQ7747704.1 sugar transferase [Paludibacteraceae bacterium]MBR0498279.1 sugar transferase [Paludibacteraceae bacterium]
MKSEVYIKDGMTRGGRLIKNSADIFLAAVFMILSTPLWIIIYIAIKKEDNGSVLYKQERIGKFGRPFYILKFRSMKIDAEQNGPRLYKAGVDERMTKVGKFLREHHLDELPQLINVLKGEMSFVGPRPERQYYIEKIMEIDDRYPCLYQVKPGVTSYATLYHGYCDTVEKMVKRLRVDLLYIRRRSLWTDIKIAFATVFRVSRGTKF